MKRRKASWNRCPALRAASALLDVTGFVGMSDPAPFRRLDGHTQQRSYAFGVLVSSFGGPHPKPRARMFRREVLGNPGML